MLNFCEAAFDKPQCNLTDKKDQGLAYLDGDECINLQSNLENKDEDIIEEG